jgi:hypothetical protein
VENGEQLAVNASGVLPSLSGAWIRSSERSGDQLSLELEGLRRGGLVYAGEIVFTGVTNIEIASDRPLSRPPAARRPTGTIIEAHAAPGVTVLDTQSQPGPGEVDSLQCTIRHAGVDVHLRPSLSRTVRRLAGLYPRPGDLHG